MLSFDNLALRRPRNIDLARLGRDTAAGLISGVLQIAYCVSFAALIFTGDLASGFALGLSGLIMGVVVTCIIIALTSTFYPAVGGPDSPAVAVMAVLASSVAAALAAKGASHEQIIVNILVALSVSTLLTGILLYGIGALRLGQWLRFVPFPVIGGFLAASGLLLITGGVGVITQTDLTLSPASWAPFFSTTYAPQILIGVLFAVAIPLLSRWVPDYLALPLVFLVLLVVLDIGLLGFVEDEAIRSAWFLPNLGELSLWWPADFVFGNQVDWHVIAMSAAEIGSFCGVMAIALLLDVTSLEVARQKTADLDQEFRSNGLANLLASVFGGFGGSLSMNGCVLLDESGATTRWSGAVIGIAAAFILVSGFDVGAIVPKALLGGMLAYLGAVIIVELFATPTRSSWMEWALTGLMTLVIINFGYFMGVVVGVVGACLLFAVSYSRIGVIRRHLTRYEFSSNVERSPEQARLLHDQGKRVHVFWLSGFIFFGSSNGLFERIKGTIEDQQDTPVNYVVLDFSAVQGLDTSAVLSLIKLRNYCEEHGVVIAFSGLDENMRAGFDRAGFFGNDKPHQAFGSRNEAVEWCEDMLLMHHEVGDASTHSFESWIQKELGEQFDISRISPYMKLEELKPGEFLFRQGEPSDSIAFQTSGSVAITIQDEHGRPIRLRRMLGHTVVGEMGFFRKVPRAASIIAEGPTVVYRLTRESFDKMQQEDPTAAAALHKLIIRLLSDRLEFANREISALI